MLPSLIDNYKDIYDTYKSDCYLTTLQNFPYFKQHIIEQGDTDTDGDQEMICLDIDRVIFNDPATIIFWNSTHLEEDENGSLLEVQDKTVVKCAKGEKFNKYHGFCAAVAKRIFETNSAITRIVNTAYDDTSKKVLRDIQKSGKKVKAQKEKKK